MSFRFHPDAETEFLNAIQYYENVEPGLELDLAVEVHAAIQRAVAYPKAWTEFDREIRRSLVRRFPYGVLYTETDDGIFILAVMHLHRDPVTWRRRV